jgi:hypothetical protein
VYKQLSSVLQPDEITEWKSRPASSVLALTGAARSGKSALLASIWSSLDTSLGGTDSVFLFFSFERLGSKDVSALLLPRMLLWQLLTQRPECTRHLDSAVKDYGLSAFCSIPLLWSVLGNAFGSLQPSQLFIALDGFDSCLVSLQETAVSGLATSFSKIQHNSITLRLLIALRDPAGDTTRPMTDGLHPSELQASSVLRVAGSSVSRQLVATNPKWNLEDSEDLAPEERNQLSIIGSVLDAHAGSDLLLPMLQLYMAGVILQDDQIPVTQHEFISRLKPETVAMALSASSELDTSEICRAILSFYAKQLDDLPLLVETISLFGPIPHSLATDLCPTFDFSLLPFLKCTDSDISFVHHSFAWYFAPSRDEKRVLTRIGISSLYYLDSNTFDKNESQITSAAISEVDFFVNERQEYHFKTRFLSTCVDGGVLTEEELAIASGLILLDSPRSRSWFQIVRSFIPLPLGSPCQSSETTELHTATICGFRDLILWYTQTFDASLTVVDKLGRIPLHYAAALGDMAAAELLFADGSSITFPDKDGVTPLELASWPGNEEMAFMLLERLTARRFSGQPIFSLTENNTARIAFLIRLAHQRTDLPPAMV